MGPADDGAEWWRTAVIYQIYPRSFADANGDGIGDLAGITERLDALVSLGIDAVWLSPFYPSPQRDAGYDVADYCEVDPLFGTLADFDDAARPGPSAGPAGDHRPGAQPHLVGPSLVHRGAGRAARLSGAPALPLPGRADRLAVGLRRQRLDPGAGRAVVHAPVRRGPARSQLALRRRTGLVRRGAALLARPRGRRLPRRRRARAGQGRLVPVLPRSPAVGAGQGGGAVLGPGRRCTRSTGPGGPCWTSTPPPTRLGRGCLCARPTCRCRAPSATSAPTRCTRPSTSRT